MFGDMKPVMSRVVWEEVAFVSTVSGGNTTFSLPTTRILLERNDALLTTLHWININSFAYVWSRETPHVACCVGISTIFVDIFYRIRGHCWWGVLCRVYAWCGT
jgi:hypothetical protein